MLPLEACSAPLQCLALRYSKQKASKFLFALTDPPLLVNAGW
jgi:hypothetical protein